MEPETPDSSVKSPELKLKTPDSNEKAFNPFVSGMLIPSQSIRVRLGPLPNNGSGRLFPKNFSKQTKRAMMDIG
ncbi:hypothetical protein [Lentibacillus cibarius]|uniref:Uncharacterized protein n=1 Tax=Lentibacillus cibarius TaxID=2583219 RepID=A0A5S3R7V9_9BACI|nr:hypothetical protein [Lentibacillus cibarius]TMN22793.1 hypothetical protein FFL34_12310 [Lentibacillus cibarius]